jgi:hypothetical protein
VHLVKSDTEGHDLRVLSGARKMLSQGRIDVFQFEYNQRWITARFFLKDAFALVAGMPYTVARIRPSHIELFEAWHFELERFFEANYLIVHERALGWFDVQRGGFNGSNVYV